MVLIPPGFRESLVYFNSRDLISNDDVDVVPTDDDEVIGGHTLADVLFGLGGNDRIVANAGNDILAGDAGEDTLVGGRGSDTLLGGDDDDYVDGGAGNDAILGGAGNDELIGRGGRDEFDGGTGNDNIRGGGGFDQAHYSGDILTEDGEFNFEFMRLGNSRGWITDTNAADGDLGTDLLRSIERIKFDDFDVNLNGENNDIIAFDDTVETDEDNAVTFNVLDNDVDFDVDFLGLVDDDDIVSVDDSAILGSLTVDFETGDITYDPEDAFQFLALGEEATEIFTYVVTDSNGATDEASVEITVIGLNDQPITMDVDATVGEDDAEIVIDLSMSSSDIDATDILSYALFGPEEIRGSININETTGIVTFVPGDDFQYLNAGETAILEFQYQAIDDSGADNDTSEASTLTITVVGSDDADVETTDSFNFMSDDQSTFGTGSALVLEPDLPFIGLDTDFSRRTTIIPSIDILVAETPAVGIDFDIDAKIGLQPIFTLTSGDIDSQLTGDLTFLVPDQVIPGQEITLETGFRLSDGSFQTFSPNITLGLDLIFELASRLAFFVGDDDFEIFDFDISEVIELFRFSGEDASLEIPLPADSSLTVGFPVINTVSDPFVDGDTSITSTGESNPILSATFDVDGLITTLLNAAGVPVPSLEDSIDFDFAGFTFTAFYNLLDLEFTGDLTIQQDFDLSLGDLAGVLTLENGDVINFTPGEDITLIVPEYFDVDNDEILDFSVELDINGDSGNDSLGALLEQVASLNFDLDFDISLLSGGISAEFLSVDLGTFEIGPLFEDSIDIFDADRFATIFDDQFGLVGFNNDNGDFGIDASLLNDSGLMMLV